MKNWELIFLFNVLVALLFGFIAWKPEVWVRLTPIKPTTDEKLTKIYRWLAIITLCGTVINELWMYR